MQVDVTAIVLGSQQLVTDRTETGWQTRAVARFDAYTEDGSALVAVTGDQATLLGLLGFDGNLAAAQDWPAGEGGAAPTMTEVAAWWTAQLAAKGAALAAAFAGKQATAFVAAGD